MRVPQKKNRGYYATAHRQKNVRSREKGILKATMRKSSFTKHSLRKKHFRGKIVWKCSSLKDKSQSSRRPLPKNCLILIHPKNSTSKNAEATITPAKSYQSFELERKIKRQRIYALQRASLKYKYQSSALPLSKTRLFAIHSEKPISQSSEADLIQITSFQWFQLDNEMENGLRVNGYVDGQCINFFIGLLKKWVSARNVSIFGVECMTTFLSHPNKEDQWNHMKEGYFTTVDKMEHGTCASHQASLESRLRLFPLLINNNHWCLLASENLPDGGTRCKYFDSMNSCPNAELVRQQVLGTEILPSVDCEFRMIKTVPQIETECGCRLALHIYLAAMGSQNVGREWAMSFYPILKEKMYGIDGDIFCYHISVIVRMWFRQCVLYRDLISCHI